MMEFFASMMQDVSSVLRNGQPPLYVQITLVTMAFILLRLLVLLRRRRRATTPPNEWLMGGYLGLLALLSLGVWDHLRTFYDSYVAHAFRVYFG